MPCTSERLQERGQERDRDEQNPDPEHQSGSRGTCASLRRASDPRRAGALDGEARSGARRFARGRTGAATPAREAQVNCSGRWTSCTSALDPFPIARQKKSVAAVPNTLSGRDGEALVAPALRPRDRLRPLRLQVRAGRAVEERRLELAPAALEVDPRELGRACAGSLGIVATAGRRSSVRAGRVVAADALLGRAAEEQRLVEEVRVRAGRRVHDRMRPVDEVELVVAPGRPLRSLVLAVADLAGCSASASPAFAASKSSWIISQSPSCRLFQSL